MARSVAIRVIENAPRPRKAFPCLAMAFGTESRRGDDIFGFISAGTALHLEYGDALRKMPGRIVRCEMPFRAEAFHADRHRNSPSSPDLQLKDRQWRRGRATTVPPSVPAGSRLGFWRRRRGQKRKPAEMRQQ